MQKKVLAEKLREQAEKLQKLLPLLSSPENLQPKETENILFETEQLSRILSACKFLGEHKELFSDLNVHMKIMENINKQDEVRTVTETTEEVKSSTVVVPNPKPEVAAEKKPEPQKTNPEPIHKEEKLGESKIITRKKIELGINDKYRMINELFHQSSAEFTAALDQLNMTESQEDADRYLDSLKTLYSWKTEHPLVKMLYSFTQKRFQ
jgi:hypothetical protein